MLIQLLSILALVLAGIKGVFYIWKAHQANKNGSVTTKYLTFSRVDTPSEFKIYVWGRYLSGVVLLVSSLAVAYVFSHLYRPNP